LLQDFRHRHLRQFGGQLLLFLAHRFQPSPGENKSVEGGYKFLGNLHNPRQHLDRPWSHLLDCHPCRQALATANASVGGDQGAGKVVAGGQ
jgi:hypothetical protein